MSHVFLSYVREDSRIVGYIAEVLRKNDITVWVDRDNLNPGERWRDAIRTAIQGGQFYLPIFTKAWANRQRSEANEELLIAIDELRKRPRDRAWFIPLRIDECDVPNYPIGAAETLGDIQRLDFSDLGWTEALGRLLRALGVENPVLEMGEPLGSGLSANLDITQGQLICENGEPRIPQMNGLTFAVIGGSCRRTEEGHILAYIKTRAPNVHSQKINEQLGLDSFYAISTDGYVSTNSEQLNTFQNSRKVLFPAGSELFDMPSGQLVRLPFDVECENTFTARGCFSRNSFCGTFEAVIVCQIPGQQMVINLRGRFEIVVSPSNAPHFEDP